MAYPTDVDMTPFDSQRRRLYSDQGSQLAANEYARYASQQRSTRNREGQTLSWNANRNRLPGQFMQRNLGMKSGVWKQALANFQTRRNMNFENLDADAFNQERDYANKAADITRYTNDALLTVEEQRQQALRAALANLAGLTPFNQ